MILILTGTPGTGKTTISCLLAEKLGYQLVDVNQLVDEKHLYTGLDPEKDYKIVDMEALEEELHKILEEDHLGADSDEKFGIIIEGHLSHYFPQADLVVVLRTEPSILKGRLQKRGWKETKIHENLEAEALDICTWEAHQIHSTKVHEIETTNLTPEEAVNLILEVIAGKKLFPVGEIDFSGYLGG
ncbi:MAG: adenylate kinase family protein [Methanobacterium sp.]|jgi:adenylate kinase|uniref:Putative adenylate kinase n=1 Tax=Methanobacterium subterraneum TaxID=59277 RepID=A0A2H4VQK1_9EURY|nr:MULTISPECIES: adenylate kinase family protein [Methanobacterium]AUB60346.1 nucleoside kinase [Methanobacterium subterraneum]MCC7558826.1 adenylate kinase family protein [Methanobacterium sp.]